MSIQVEAAAIKRIGCSALVAVLVLHWFGPTVLAVADDIKVYKVGKRVSDYKAKDDFSSPEAAYATINHLLADGNGDWRAVSTAKLAGKIPPKQATMVTKPKKQANDRRDAVILEVRVTL